MWGIIPAAGLGSRIQPLAFSKELLPVGSRIDAGRERPRAVGEYLLERMVEGGATRICMVIAPGKSDLIQYFGARFQGANLCYVVQSTPAGLCDAIFQAASLIEPTEHVAVGLPDTVWFPSNGLLHLPEHILSFLLFPVDRPELFDAVRTTETGAVKEILVKQQHPGTRWVWGAFKMPGHVFRALHDLWLRRECQDEYWGTLVNEYLASGGKAVGIHAGEDYVDVGTLNGYREAIRLLERKRSEAEWAATRGTFESVDLFRS